MRHILRNRGTWEMIQSNKFLNDTYKVKRIKTQYVYQIPKKKKS